jgi:hypothetical protein
VSLFSRQREPGAVDVLMAQVQALSQQVGALQAAVQALQTRPAALTNADPVALPDTPDHRPVWAALQSLAPDEGPFRRHLMRTAAGLLLDPSQTPETVADLLMRGSDDDE